MEEALKEKVLEKGIKKWHIKDCSLCDYPCGFLFTIANGKVFVNYDAGCWCCPEVPRISSFGDVLEHIELQSDEQVIERYQKFWQ